MNELCTRSLGFIIILIISLTSLKFYTKERHNHRKKHVQQATVKNGGV